MHRREYGGILILNHSFGVGKSCHSGREQTTVLQAVAFGITSAGTVGQEVKGLEEDMEDFWCPKVTSLD